MKEIFSSSKIKEFALNVFKVLFSYDKFKSLEQYISEKSASDGAKKYSFNDGAESIPSCFISPFDKVKKRNSPTQRWFEERGLYIKRDEVFLSDQWYGDDRKNSTAIQPLQHFVNQYYKNVYKIEINQGHFSLLDVSKNTEGSLINEKKKAPSFYTYQNILFGAPGTGKSFRIDDPEKGYGLKNVDESQKFRTTFHPDYDYAQFVGAYKPKKESNSITYSFAPQVFAKAYAAAWKQYFSAGNKPTTENQVYLVIEEINRGNCAQIFGDIFQLLDRNGDGFSQYSIDADCDFAEWLEMSENGLKSVWEKYKESVGEGKLKLPPNLNILATMNTSDQSLFPMDSAFKRRFDWEYVPISFDGKDAANFQIDIDGTQYPWQKFVETVNEKILTLTESEDKQLGEFFIKLESGNVISKDRFLGKVMFYLWNEVCKDEHKNGSFFRTKDGDKEKYFTFQDLYRDKGLLKRFIEKLFEKGPSRE